MDTTIRSSAMIVKNADGTFDFSGFIADRTKNFIGREWVTNEVDSWLRQAGAPRYLVISGEPGIGKSAIAAELVRKGYATAHHFCSALDAATVIPDAFVRSVSQQLGNNLKGFTQLIVDALPIRINAEQQIGVNNGSAANVILNINFDKPQRAFTQLIRDPLIALHHKETDPRIVIIIDSLDEAKTYTNAMDIVSLLLGCGVLPDNVRFILTTRPDQGILKELTDRRLPFIHLDAGRSEHKEDIKKYILKRLASSEVLAEFRDNNKVDDDTFAISIALAAADNFLCANMLLTALEKKEQGYENLDALPRGLDEIYYSFFTARFTGDWQSRYAPLFGILATAREALHLKQLVKLSGMHEDDLWQYLYTISQFLVPEALATDTLRIYHQSVVDFLFDRKRSGPFFISNTRYHGVFCDYYIGLYREWQQKLCKKGAAEFDADGYAQRHLIEHLHCAAKDETIRVLLLEYTWLEEKLKCTGINELLADFTYVQNDATCVLVEKALRMSSHILQKDNGQLGEQLTGRLCGYGETDSVINTLLERIVDVKRIQKHVWLRILHPSMQQAGGPLIRTFVGHSDSVTSVAIHPDGRRALSGSIDNTLKLWDLENGECIKTLIGHSGGVISVVIHPDGLRALSGSSYDKTLKLWDLASGECIRTLEGHSENVTSIAIHQDGQRALSGSDDKTVKLWDLKTGECISTLEGHSDGVKSVAIYTDGRRSISGSFDQTIKLWDLTNGECICTFRGDPSYVNSVTFHPNGLHAISGSLDGTLKLWDLKRGECIRTFSGHMGAVKSVAIHPDGLHAFSGSWDQTLKLWDLASGECIRTLEGHSENVTSIAIHPDGQRAISSSEDGTLKLWDLEKFESSISTERHPSKVYSLAIHPDCRHVISFSAAGVRMLWDLENGKFIRILEWNNVIEECFAFHPDGLRSFSTSCRGILTLWDLEKLRIIRHLEGHSGYVTSVVFHPNGLHALSCSQDKTLKLWDLEKGECIRTLNGHSGWVISLAIHPDGIRAISGSEDGTYKLWNLAIGKCLKTFEAPFGIVNSVAFHPDGIHACLCCFATLLYLEFENVLPVHLERCDLDAEITCCAINKTGTLIVAGDTTGRVHFLKLENFT